jgi:outer membrane protein TolC
VRCKVLKEKHLRRNFPVFFLFTVFALTPVLPWLTSTARGQPLTVLEGLETVASKGYDVRIAEAYREAAAHSEGIARSGMRPQVNASADYTWLKNRPEAIFGGGSSPLSEDRYLRYGVSLRQSLTDFGRTRARVDSARAGALAREGGVDQARSGTALSFLQGYIGLLEAEKNLDVARQEVKRFEAHVSDVQALYDAGEVTRSDILSAEVNLADARQKKITAQDGRELAEARVNFLLLKPMDNPLEVLDFPSPFSVIPGMDELIETAEDSRPELRILAEQITAMQGELKLRKSDHYPTVFVSGGYSFEENPYRVHEDNWSAMLGISWDLYTGGANTAAEAKSSLELSAALTELERLKGSIFLEVREAFLMLNGAAERMGVTEKALRQAEENLRLRKAMYQEGEASATDVTDAVSSVTRAQNNHWGAVYDKRRAEAQILYATGADLTAAYGAVNPGGENGEIPAGMPGEQR